MGPSAALPQCTTAARPPPPVHEPVNPVGAAGAEWSASRAEAAPCSSPESAAPARPERTPGHPPRRPGSPFKRHILMGTSERRCRLPAAAGLTLLYFKGQVAFESRGAPEK